MSSYLDEVLLLDGAERTAWLRDLASKDPDLAAEIGEWLARDEAARREGFLAGGPPLPMPSAAAGAAIGAYTLDEPIGHGGMGQVWLAHRSDGRYQGRAAVKLLDARRIGSGQVARFQREGELLARLVHPNIAHLLDAGMSEAGQPYLVLEYVDGAPIDRACDERRLDLAARLRLFLEVLEAVAYAHAHLVVHRDIKPSNVMVSREGRAKLLDFGIGKLMEGAGASDATALTREAGTALTPEFAAPEQLEGGPVTTATDVYALGGLLYLLMTGRHFSASGPAATPAEVIRARLQADPVRPSAAAAAGEGTSPATLARARGTTPEQLRRMLAGDLDNILLKALAREPGRRYASAEAFAEDLRRHLDHRPVAAREAAWPYLATRFLRRHRVPAVLGAVAALSLVAGLTVSLAQARTARRERAAALRQMHVAEATNSFTSYLLSSAAATGRPFTAAELVARGEEALEHELRPDSPMRIHLLLDLAQHYQHADDHAAAERLAQRALDLSQRSDEPLARALAACKLAFLEAYQGRLEEAGRLIEVGRQSLAQVGDPAITGSACLVEDSLVARRRGDLGRAIESARRARDLARADADSPPDALEEALSALALAQAEAGLAAEANTSYAELDAAFRASHRDRTGGAAVVLLNWAIHLANSGQVERSLAVARRVAELDRGLDPERGERPFTLVTIANALAATGRWTEADADFEEAERKVRARSLTTLVPTVLAARAWHYAETGDAGRLAALLPDLERAVQAAAAAPSNPWHAAVRLARGRLALLGGSADRALQEFDEAIGLTRSGGQWNPTHYRAVQMRAEALLALGRLAEAEASAREVVAWTEGQLGGFPHSFRSGLAHRVLGQVLEARGDHGGALGEWRRAHDHCRDTVGPDAPATRWLAARLETR